MDLEEYDKKVGVHLDFIRHGVEMVERHVAHIEERPDFVTVAESDLDNGIKKIEESLLRIKKAREAFLSKPVMPE